MLLPQAAVTIIAGVGMDFSDRLALVHTRRPQTPVDVTSFRKNALPGVCTIADALKAKDPWGCLQAIQAHFFCGVDKHLLYMLTDEIRKATCGSNLFLKCMFHMWKNKNKNISDHFVECIQITIFDT